MSDCCCASNESSSERIPQGWQCPCCGVVYAPSVGACYCCVEEYEIAPETDAMQDVPKKFPRRFGDPPDEEQVAPASVKIPVAHQPAPRPPNPWYYTIQPPPYYTNLQITVEAAHAEG